MPTASRPHPSLRPRPGSGSGAATLYTNRPIGYSDDSPSELLCIQRRVYFDFDPPTNLDMF